LEKNNLAKKTLEVLNLKSKLKLNLQKWEKISQNISSSKKTINIALVGKYTDNPDAYISIVESIKHAGINNLAKVAIVPIDSEKINIKKDFENIDGIVIPGGFGIRGIEGKIQAIQFARENKIPFLGLCLGLQCAVIEFARNVCNLKNANSTEFDAKTLHPLIDILPEQRKIIKKGGSMRLGQYEAILTKKSLVSQVYGNQTRIFERHRHRFEVNPKYHKTLKDNGMIFSGMSKNKKLVEFIELPQNIHPYFVCTQAHPEFKSRPYRPAPLFDNFVKIIKQKI
ncbi:MAG: CTP synthase, partial [Candidatus Berkelbacteria bacterium Licking1014_85]